MRYPEGNMIKYFSAAALIATATATLLVAPATTAQAQSPTCSTAIDLINAAVDSSGDSFDLATQQALADRLHGLAAVSSGEEQRVIAAYADALIDDNVTYLTPFTDDLNRVCA
ncbi:hypothetical protein [Nocardia jejuensis]|uniref:hypothetical protein n=1 Tax=Nocardia jejuensis TaxID=328049 RepID=UPI0012FA7E8C|nr:hypothetical protein [Nocardia jejuensis]